MFIKNKRGISPLIATVLLVSFVVILAIVILLWGKEYVTELMEKRGEVAAIKLKCENIEIEVLGIQDGKLSIRNTGPDVLAGLVLKYSEVGAMDLNEPIASYEDKLIPLTVYTGTVDVIPMLKPDGIGAPSIPCSSKHKLINL
jgi:flagellin-like protein